MNFSTLNTLSPLDGRYAEQVSELKAIFSEFSFIKQRLMLEIKWLKTLALEPKIKELPPFSKKTIKFLDDIVKSFNEKDATRIKDIESKIKHDIKAVEYFLREKFLINDELSAAQTFIHFACTSEDINNLAYSLMIKTACEEHLLPHMSAIFNKLQQLAHKYATQPMLARTHGQPASPTTLGKELANFAVRFKRSYSAMLKTPIMGKLNGTVGNFNAHTFVYPQVDWLNLTKNFVTELGLHYNGYTTQIEPHDYIAELCDALTRFNTIAIGLTRDIWHYMAFGFLQQKIVVREIGSSVMPHKVNPIDFENAEGNLGMANALLKHLSSKLPISRWQRDLSDSTVLRNIGVAFGHTLLAYKMLESGLDNIVPNNQALVGALEGHWEILAEAIQTTMRRYGISDSYEKMKTLTRGKKINKKLLHAFIKDSKLPASAKNKLLKLTPTNYLGKAEELARKLANGK